MHVVAGIAILYRGHDRVPYAYQGPQLETFSIVAVNMEGQLANLSMSNAVCWSCMG